MTSRLRSPLVLASTSAFRRALMAAAGLPFEVEAPGVDEIASPGLSPKAVARRLARLKAEAVGSRHPDALVIGSDQTLDLDGELLRKPGSRAEARRQIAGLAGREHALHTAVALVGSRRGFARDSSPNTAIDKRR